MTKTVERTRSTEAMTKPVKDMDELGPIDIIREGLKMRRAHFKAFRLIQLTLMAPLGAFLVALQYYLYLQQSGPPGPPVRGGSPGGVHVSHLHRHLSASVVTNSAPADTGLLMHMVLPLLVAAVFSIIFQTAISLSTSVTIYCVRLHYAGQPISFLDVLRACTPKLWMRLSVTNIYTLLLAFPITLLQSVSLILLVQYAPAQPWLYIGLGVSFGLSVVVGLSSQVLSSIAAGVSVLDDDAYGWAAIGKGLKLLSGRLKVAFLLQLLVLALNLAELPAQNLLRSQFAEGGCSVRTLLAILLFIVWTTLIWQLQALCSGVQYMSFTAYHDENLPESRILKGEYDLLEDGTKVPMIHKEQAAGSTV